MYDQWTIDLSEPDPNVFKVEDPNFFMEWDGHVALDQCRQYDADGILRDDPNEPVCDFQRMYDPNRLVEVQVVLVGSEPNDVLSIEIMPDAQLVIDLTEPWLGDSETHDLNGDGIVNMIDFTIMSTR
jgi:hypothetical protein